ncbi:Deoxyribonuclease-2-alpha [Trichinella spiralis]|uniref:Deoxyribonuclease-2-alpha n=1 Tax=Trichinella spiralis TaxID=6334 RepID=A0ABR3K802_TRISP
MLTCRIVKATSKCQNAAGAGDADWAILYKAPAQPNGKILHAGAAGGNWANSPQPITRNNGHSFAKALEHVIAANADNKFISYNNHPPDVPKVRTKSNSKGVLMMDITAADSASWIVHTEDQIDTIAMTLRIATPLIYYNDIPNAQMNSRPNLRKLVFGLKVTIYSKGEKSRYEIYRKILLKKLKSTVKWLVTETGNKFCAVDKPYQKSQAMEPAMAVCIDDASISARFKEIAQNVENCS